jgi:hypothetical protein
MPKRAARNAAPTAAAIRASLVTPPRQTAAGRRRDGVRAAAVVRRAQLGEASSGRKEARYGLILVLCVGNLFGTVFVMITAVLGVGCVRF